VPGIDLDTRVDAGYLTDVEYTGGFQDHLAPSWLSYIAAINGHVPPPLDRPFAWCELGCGRGITSLLLAATHPSGQFHACDFNPAHIEYAESLQRAAAVGNVQFHHKSFAQMLEAADLPPFDFVVLHGVYSWVGAPVRAQIHAFLERRLRPGGLAMVSYNAMPGWAHLQPIRHMMRTYAEHVSGSSLEKARAAYAYVQCLHTQGAGYFAALPAAAQHLQEIAAHDIRYVAHEYLTPHGDPFYFSEVESGMRASGLAFAGSMTPEDNYAELMAGPQFKQLPASAPSRTALETHRDFFANTRFRRDLYAAQPQVPRVRSVPACFDGLAFCLADVPERLGRRPVPAILQAELSRETQAAGALYARLERGPATAGELHAAAGKPSVEQTWLLLQRLVVARHLAPCPPLRPVAGWLQANTALVEAGIREEHISVPLACPATGSASTCEVIYASAIEAAARCKDAADAAESVLARVRAHGHPVNKQLASGEKLPATDDEVREYIAATWRSLGDASNADARLLRLFGILS
jgi:trans-aconitate methyltransferase